MSAGLAPRSCIFFVIVAILFTSISLQITLPVSSSSALPERSASLTSAKNSFLALLVGELSIMVFILGKIASTDSSISLEIVLAIRASPPASPLDFLINAKASGVQPLLDLNQDPTLSIHLSN